MQKPQVIVLVLALALAGVLYSLPKVLVAKKEAIGGQPAKAQSTEAAEGVHANALTADQQTVIDRLRNDYQHGSAAKKIIFADSLITLFRQTSQFDSAAHYAEAIVKQQPSLTNLVKAGDAYYDAMSFATEGDRAKQMGLKVQEYYGKVLKQNPDQLEVKARMAMTYVAAGTPMQGVAMLREVLQKDPKNEPALLNMGLLSVQSGQYDKAIGRFEEVLKVNPANEQAQFYLGISHAETGHTDQARTLLRQVAKNSKDPAIKQAAEQYLKKIK